MGPVLICGIVCEIEILRQSESSSDRCDPDLDLVFVDARSDCVAASSGKVVQE